MSKKKLYRISFYNNEVIYELYVRKIYESDLFGFIVLEDFVFGENTSLVIDPAEERIRMEFNEVKRTLIPAQSVLRIDEVDKQGVAKVLDKSSGSGGSVAVFPGSNKQNDR